MNLTIEKTVLTLFSLMVCLSIGAPLILTGIDVLGQSQDIIQVEAMVQEIDDEIQFLSDNPDATVEISLFIPVGCRIRGEDNTLIVEYILAGDVKIRSLTYAKSIRVEGGDNTGDRTLFGYCIGDVITLVIT
ncbi:MAG: hypothetical protein ACTSVM_04010 [Candidatus Ranarchaeia archaeon]